VLNSSALPRSYRIRTRDAGHVDLTFRILFPHQRGCRRGSRRRQLVGFLSRSRIPRSFVDMPRINCSLRDFGGIVLTRESRRPCSSRSFDRPRAAAPISDVRHWQCLFPCFLPDASISRPYFRPIFFSVTYIKNDMSTVLPRRRNGTGPSDCPGDK